MADWETGSAPDADLGQAMREIRLVDPVAPRDTDAVKFAAEKGWTPAQPTQTFKETSEAADEVINQIAQQFPQFASGAAKYEHSGEFGEIGPVNKALEEELFGGELRVRVGVHVDELYNVKVINEATDQNRPQPIRDFNDAGLHPAMLQNIQLCGYSKPTPIQCYTIPAVLRGHDVIGIAQTGSGKTLGFMAPALSKLMGKAKKLRGPRGDRVCAQPLLLVVAPTRELCIQIFDEARRLCYRSMLRPCIAYGGGPSREQRADLQKGCDVLIATPGRLIDFLHSPDTLSLHRLRYTIIDEADEMLHDDWSDELNEIMGGGGATQDAQHQYLLFSATFPPGLRKLAKKYLQQDYVRIRIGRTGSTHKYIKQQIFWVDGNKKQDALYDLIIAGPACRTMIFVKSKKMVDIIDDFLYHKGMPVTSLHSDRSQIEREDTIRAFRSGKCPILVTTGVAGRGLDVKNVLHVINYDLPSIEYGGQEDYVHRVGRTGRLGANGLVSSFFNDADEPMGPFLAKLLIENGQEVPDFLEQYKPAEDEPLTFEDQSEDDDDDAPDSGKAASHTNGGGDAWGEVVGGKVIAEREHQPEQAWGGKSEVAANGDDGW